VEPDAIDVIYSFGLGVPDCDQAEASALRSIFGEAMPAVLSTKPTLGNCGAGAGGLDIAAAALALQQQQAMPVLNREKPLDGIGQREADGELTHALVYAAGYGGQNTALVLRRVG